MLDIDSQGSKDDSSEPSEKPVLEPRPVVQRATVGVQTDSAGASEGFAADVVGNMTAEAARLGNELQRVKADAADAIARNTGLVAQNAQMLARLEAEMQKAAGVQMDHELALDGAKQL